MADIDEPPTPEAVTQEVTAGVLTLRLNRPSKYNAISTAMLSQLRGCLANAQHDPAIRVVVLTGSGPAFAAGADIKEYSTLDAAGFGRFTELANTTCLEIERSTVPVVAAVNGLALGGGFELVLACDLVVAGTDATFGLPEMSLGLIPGWGGTQRLTQLLGPYRARHLILTGRRLSADEARHLGIVAEVYDGEELVERSYRLAESLAVQPRQAVTAALRSIAAASPHENRLAPGFAVEQAELQNLFSSSDAQEGVRAFLGKRTPRFDTSPPPHPMET